MLEGLQSGTLGPVSQADDSVVALASRALSTLAFRTLQEAPDLPSAFVIALHDAALSQRADPFLPVLAEMDRSGISRQQIADHYLPAVARKLGEEWSQDNKTFCEVTIGVARLQRLLYDLGPEWRAESGQQFDAPSVLVLTGSTADHTFGARIIRGQLRRRGLSVRLALGLRPDQVKSLMGIAHFDAVMISASLAEALVPLRNLVDAVRSSSNAPLPIVLGGSICALDVDVKARTGVDHATCDIDEAIRLCGLDKLAQIQTPPMKKR